MNNRPDTVIDRYLSGFPKHIQELLEQVRAAAKKTAPGAEEAMKYGMPTLVLDGNLIHFAACKNHIGFYPTPSAIEAFKKELSIYQCSKGAIQFPLDKPLPLALISKMTAFRVAENLKRSKARQT